MTMVRNEATPEGREFGRILAKWCDEEAAKTGRDGRCDTCAGRAGDHDANGSISTLVSFIKCAGEREPFWCHEHDRPCAAWLLLRMPEGETVTLPWEHPKGADKP